MSKKRKLEVDIELVNGTIYLRKFDLPDKDVLPNSLDTMLRGINQGLISHIEMTVTE